ncbi:MAG TPA: MATE family efflux transporter [Bacteroidia bacterium]|nr:MATE family efflux transporter [Bacteroidia bacterium]HRS58873.1 MATE family efflux transporter [Bacteroidia bacterium]HRU67370.1 MATE family efflux transporter [Bacteroidia bacterium]
MQVNTSYRNILEIALPIILGSFSQAILSVVDTAFLGRVDEVTLAAGAIGGTFYLIFSLLTWAMSMGTQIIIARRTGEGKDVEIGKTFNQGNYLLLAFSVLLFLLISIPGPAIMKLLVSNNDIYYQSISFLNYRSFGLFFVALGAGFRALYIGISKTAIITYATIIMSVFNGILDYFLIFGHWIFPAMGIKGAALASSLSEAMGFLVFIYFTRSRHDFRKYNIFHFPGPDFSLIGKIVNLSYPSVLQYLISIVSWFAFFVIIEKTGQDKLAASNVIRSLLMLIMFPVWGFAATANTMVSNLLGQNKRNEMKKLILRIISTNYIWVIFLLPLIIFSPHTLLRIITSDSQIIGLSVNSLYSIFFALMVFTVSANLLHSLSGTGDTRSAFLIEVAAIIVYLVYTFLTSVVFSQPLEIIWLAEAIYWIVIGTLSFWRLKSGRWVKIQV